MASNDDEPKYNKKMYKISYPKLLVWEELYVYHDLSVHNENQCHSRAQWLMIGCWTWGFELKKKNLSYKTLSLQTSFYLNIISIYMLSNILLCLHVNAQCKLLTADEMVKILRQWHHSGWGWAEVHDILFLFTTAEIRSKFPIRICWILDGYSSSAPVSLQPSLATISLMSDNVSTSV